MYTVKLETFEGPLELLLELIEKNKLAISDVSLAQVTDQFLEYSRHFEEIDPAHLADFLVVAAKLILIKSKALLPFLSVSEDEEREITDLKEKLALYQKIRDQARELGILERRRLVMYHKPSGLRHVTVFAPPEGVGVNELHRAFSALLVANIPEEPLKERRIEAVISFEEKIEQIRKRIGECFKMYFHEMAGQGSRHEIVVSFLAVLELVRQKTVTVQQQELFGIIELVKTN